jgi:SAM-dependent methyltransferase
MRWADWYVTRVRRRLRSLPASVRAPYVSPERYLEFREILARLPAGAGDRVLDIGSEVSLFPHLVACRCGARVVCLDPFEDVRFQHDYARALGIAGRIAIVRASGTHLCFATGSLRWVTCISVLEHIPGNGDTETAAEAARVLAPGGRLFVTFPWQRHYYEYWGTEPLYANQARSTLKLITRFYDRESLDERLVVPSGLRVLDQAVFSKPSGTVARMLARTPLRALGEIVQSRAYRRVRPGEEQLHRQYVCVAVLGK